MGSNIDARVVAGAVLAGAVAGALATWLLVSNHRIGVRKPLVGTQGASHSHLAAESNEQAVEKTSSFPNLRRRNRSESWAKKQKEIKRALSDKTLRPPLPPAVQEALRDNRAQCVLSTFPTLDEEEEGQQDHSNVEKEMIDPPQPHLSLMNFTYVAAEEVVIMSTQRHTRKYRHILQSPEVALLVTSHSGAISITLNGSASVVKAAEAERFRAIHLAANPDYPQFIIGENIAIIAIHVTQARICNIKDEVKHWLVTDKSE